VLIDDGHCVTWQCLRPNVRVAVVGVPKTIDNDTTFGFDTTVEEAQKAINMACIEVLMRSAKHRSGW
jgi:6-phosphofructokinase